MKKVVLVSAAMVWAGSFYGCSNITLLRTQELRAVQSHVDSLNSKLADLQTKLYDEEKNQSEMLRLMRADQQARFTELYSKVSNIEGNLSESQTRLSKIDEKTAEFQKKLEAKMTSDSIASNSRSAEIDKLLQVAMSDFNAGRYDIAINGFKDLSSKFPDDPQAQEADYWIAECMYAKKDYEEAEHAYINYLKRYPQGPRFCVSIYKLGLAYDKQKKIKSRDMVWQKLLTQCPESDEAKMVKMQKK